MELLQTYSQKLIDLVWQIGPRFLYALIALMIGLWVIKILSRITEKSLQKARVEVSLQKFIISLIRIGLKILLLISVASMLGIATTSFIAVLGAAGLAVGLALQGSLANFAGGVLILLIKPFKVGNVIEAQGYIGKVDQIQIFNTILKTFDNKTIFIPNASLSNGNITNFSLEPTRRVDMTFGVGYNDDIKKARQILTDLVNGDERILKEPAPTVVVLELAESSVNFAVRVWVNSGDYWSVFTDFQEKVKLALTNKALAFRFRSATCTCTGRIDDVLR